MQFNNPNVTSSAPTTATSNLFGSSSPFGNIFGQSGTAVSTSAPSLFSTMTAQSGRAFTFGQPAASTTAPPLFGSTAISSSASTGTGGFVFGQPAVSTAPSATGSSLFGSLGTFGAASATTTAASTFPSASFGSPTFGATPTTTRSSIFGSSPFGSSVTSTSGFNFGTAATTTTSAPLATAAAAGTSTTSAIFGAPTTTVVSKPSGGGFPFGSLTSAPSNVFAGFGAPTSSTAAATTGQQSTGGFSFAFNAKPTASVAATSAPSFGTSATSPFSGFKPAVSTAAVTTTAAPIFGTTSAIGTTAPALMTSTSVPVVSQPTTSTQPVTSQPSIFAFTTTTKPPSIVPSFGVTTSAAVTAAPSLSLAGSTAPFSFGVATAPATTSGVQFGVPATTVAPSVTASKEPTTATTIVTLTTITTPAVSTAPAFGFTQSAAVTSTAAAVSAIPFSSFSVPSVTTTTQSFVKPISTPATTIAAPEPAKDMTYKELEDLINKWTHDVNELKEQFYKLATEVNARDRVIVTNSEKINELVERTKELQQEQRDVQFDLDFITQQQTELLQIVELLEQEFAKDEEFRRAEFKEECDTEREKMLRRQVALDTQLKQLVDDVGKLFEKMNKVTDQAIAKDPVMQIAEIMSHQMNLLQWIDQKSKEIMEKTGAIRSDAQAMTSGKAIESFLK